MQRYLPSLKRRVKKALRLPLRLSPVWLAFAVSSRLHHLLKALHHGVDLNWRSRPNPFNFRRNIHRLEKGLSFPNPRPAFAEGYILETVRALETALERDLFDRASLDWGEAVLDHYFRTVTHTPEIARAFTLFEGLRRTPRHPEQVPYAERQRPELPVGFDELLTLARRRRSVRFYLDRPVDEEPVREAMRVAALAPSSCNRQPFRFLFFNQPGMVRELAQIPGGVAGYEVPSVVVVVGRYRAYFDERDFKTPIIDASLAAMSFLFALETLGLSSVCINWPNVPDRERRIRRHIPLERDEFVVMLIGVGYPDPEGKIPFSGKREVADLLETGRSAVEAST